MAIQVPQDKPTQQAPAPLPYPKVKWQGDWEDASSIQQWLRAMMSEAAFRAAAPHLFHVYARLSRVAPDEVRWIQDDFFSAMCSMIDACFVTVEGAQHRTPVPKYTGRESREHTLRWLILRGREFAENYGDYGDEIIIAETVERWNGINRRLLDKMSGTAEDD